MTERLDIGATLSRVFQYYREQAGVLLPAALIVFIPIALIAGGIRSAGGVLAAFAAQAVQLVGNSFYQATTVEAVRDIQDGQRDLDLGGLFRSAFQVLGPVILAGIIVGIGVVIGFILLVVPGLILLTIWAVTIPSVVLERKSPIEALGRSRELVKGHGWQVFGVLVVLFILQLAVTAILVGVLAGIGDFAGAVIGSLIATVLIAPLAAIAATVIYLQLRQMKEGTAPPAGADALAPGTGTTVEGVPGSTTPPPVPPPPPPGTPPPPPPPPVG